MHRRTPTSCLVILTVLVLQLTACGDSQSGPGEFAIDADVVDATPPDAHACSLDCNGECIDPLANHDNCGATDCTSDATDGVTCGDDQMCESGACVAFACKPLTDWFHLTCNPVSNSGCSFAQKCSQHIASLSPYLAQTTCVPDGYLDIGDACNQCDAAGLGYDNCKAGGVCTGGVCREVCEGPIDDTCRSATKPVEQGSHCTNVRDLFDGPVGVCYAACDPLDDTVGDNNVTYANCGEGEGCYVLRDAEDTHAICVTIGNENTQNAECPFNDGSCFINSCKAGFGPILNNHPTDADANSCARYCAPANTHQDATNSAEGQLGRCSSASLDALGGTNGNLSAHQCRFSQTLHSSTSIPETLGVCVPTFVGDATWGDCTVFEWEGLKSAWNTAIANGTDEQVAFNEFCLATPNDPNNSETLPRCLGLRRGCISQAERQSGLPGFTF